MNPLKHLPNALTLGNLLLGNLAILFSFQGKLVHASMCILLAGVADFFDGFAARLLKTDGALGKQLDSLADVVSFGVAPAMILFNMAGMFSVGNYAYFVFMLPLFAALRLAKFNIDARQLNGFIGLPTPAMGYLVASLPAALEFGAHPFLEKWMQESITYVMLSVVLSWLMIAPIPMFSLKMKKFHPRTHRIQFLFIVLCIGLLALFQFLGIALIIFSYIILSIVHTFAQTKKTT